ncbi:hypothetical protein T06_10778 [Trichinella sp. T6]|uniref:Uncharacterized protein n=1 Tax=Trichinella murrelli TaxID=144512 RepID=A0A0V0SPS3_9BILA|nr:hypothetical protein T06_10778 [Trichinella sp. T6]KRX28718.1 hypothetical protein T05_5476 [Trichinella murrelli]
MISIPENNFYHYSIFYCTKVTLYQMRSQQQQQQQ